MKRNESVACVILNYNDANTTISLVKKIEKYESIDYIIVVDNCSTDDSLVKLETLSNSKVKICESPKNGGYGFGNNFGVQFAKDCYSAKYALIANPDVEFDVDLVDTLKDKIRKDSDVAVTSANQRGVDGLIKKSGWMLPGNVETILHGEVFLGVILDKISDAKLKRANSQNGWIYVDCVAGSLLMVEVDTFLAVGGYDPEMFLYCEESTLAKKMKVYGKKTALCTSKSYLHNHSVTISKNYNVNGQRTQLLKSTLTYLNKYCGGTAIGNLLCQIFYKLGTAELLLIKILKKRRQ